MRAEQVRIQRERYLQQQETLKKEREEAAKKLVKIKSNVLRWII